MAFLWGATPAQTEFDTLLDKTTSDLLPSSAPVDLSLSLQLADLIRSASVPPLAASKSLLLRLKHSNPNVQLLALQVLDVCIKNGGTPFLVQIADKDFSSGLEGLARGTGKDSNRDVREKTLAKVQEWAVAFKGKDNLRDTNLVRTYDKMKNEGLPFPAKDPTATAAMVDSLSAPEWQDSSYCIRCRTDFSTFNRKHHCRNCGQVFDAACSSQTAVLPHYGITEQVRVCDGCSKKIKEGKGSEVARNQSVKSDSSSGGGGKKGSSGKKSRKDQEDEDLKKAIEASLKESSDSTSHGPLRSPPKAPSSSGYNPSYASQFGSDTKKSKGGGGEEEDPDLAAAIAASLRDIVPPPTAPSFSRNDSTQALTYSQMFPTQTSSNSYTSTPRPRISLPNHDLTPSQVQTLDQFTSTFTPQHTGPSYLSYQERELARRAVEDQRALEKSLGDTRRRGEVLRELEWKLGEAARLYGAGLTERNSMYSPQIQLQPQSQYAPPQSQSHQQYVNPAYQYQSISSGQPLPSYALPPQPEPYYAPAQPQQQQQQQQQQQYEEPIRTEPQPNGFYKPSQFPSVPSGNPVSLEILPHAPLEEPWREEEERRERERQEENKVGELIEF